MAALSDRAVAVLLLVAVDLAQTAGAMAQALGRSELAGACYDLSLGPWHPAQELREDSIYIAPPSRVRFDTARIERWRSEGFALRPAPGALPSVHRHAFWRSVGDSVELLWSTGFSGLRMTLGGRPGELRGRARTFWDFGRTPTTADATARRVPCDASSQAVAQRLVFRAVPLEGGGSVAIGATLTSIRAAIDSVRGRLFRARRAPAGPFAGATAVEVAVNARDTVWRVEIPYPSGTDFESLVARFTRELGPLVSRDTLRLPPSTEAGSVSVAWSNRTTRLALRRWRTTGGEWRIAAMLTDHRIGP
jgi:hypothetical protein